MDRVSHILKQAFFVAAVVALSLGSVVHWAGHLLLDREVNRIVSVSSSRDCVPCRADSKSQQDNPTKPTTSNVPTRSSSEKMPHRPSRPLPSHHEQNCPICMGLSQVVIPLTVMTDLGWETNQCGELIESHSDQIVPLFVLGELPPRGPPILG